MPTLPNTGATLLSVSQSQKEVTANSALLALDGILALGILTGTLAARPAASWAGRLYFATDAGAQALYRDTGSAWVLQPLSPTGLAFGGGTAPSAAAGGAAGASPPVPVVAAGSNANRGTITFGTGTAPSAGAQVAITWATAFATTPFIFLTPINNSLIDLQPTPGNLLAASFSVFTKVAPAASQGNGVYQFSYLCIE